MRYFIAISGGLYGDTPRYIHKMVDETGTSLETVSKNVAIRFERDQAEEVMAHGMARFSKNGYRYKLVPVLEGDESQDEPY